MRSFEAILSSTFVVILASLLSTTQAAIAGNGGGSVFSSSKKMCDQRYSVNCLKLELVSFLERVTNQKEYNLMAGVSVVRDPGANITRTADIIAEVTRIFPTNPERRLDEFLLTKLNDYLQTHSLRLKFVDGDAFEKAREVFAGRKGKLGKKGGLETLIAGAMMMKGTLAAVGLGALALIAGKALMTGLLALMLAAIVGLKSLASGGGGGHKSTTYEIVAKPMYSHSHSEHDEVGHGHTGYGGYGRSYDLPYAGQKPK
uniref:Protein osiris 16 n=1 Tax=Anopheles funestus TaxID=62324 RepID=A0A182R853_ANOFN